MATERKIFSVLPLCMAVGLLSVAQVLAADRVMWDETGIDTTSTFSPKSIYSYAYPNKNGPITVTVKTPKDTAKPYYIQASFVAEEGAKNSGAGFGFAWELDEDYEPKAISLAAYSGVCLSYSATAQVRMDFKQPNIMSDNGGDDNFYGTLLASTSGAKVTKFVSFDDLKMGWAGDEQWRWMIGKQLGLQFSYKSDFIKKNGLTNNVVLYAVRLADECPQHAPVASATVPKTYNLNEGAKLVLHMSDIFSDEDGDELSISGSFSGNSDVLSSYDDTQHITLADSIVISVKPNPKSDKFTMTLTATDPSGRKATWTFTVNPIDVPHVPTIRDTTYQVFQGDTVSCKNKCSFYETFATDVDGDDYDLVVYEEPAFGTFTFNAELGQFTYVAPPDTFGEVYFSLYAVETGDPESVSDTVKFKIKVLDINDPPTVIIIDSLINYTIGDGDAKQIKLNNSKSFIEVSEDFTDSIWVQITADNVEFSDVDSDIEMRVKTNGVVKAELKKIGKVPYVVVTAKKDANGLAKVTYYADDGEFTAGVDFYVNVAPVVDKPIAVADSFGMVQDSTVTVAAKNGVLANDVNPDDPTIPLIPVVVKDVAHGKLKMKTDGGFTYTPEEGFVGTDSFTYYAHTDDEAKVSSDTVKVTLNVQALPGPVVAVDPKTLDTTLVEDATRELKYLKAVVQKWFNDPDSLPFTVSAKSDDGKTVVEINSTGVLVIKLAKDSVGDAYVTVSAKGEVGKAASFKIHITITPVNDKPVVVKTDSIYIKEVSGWSVKLALKDYVFDVDGDSLTFTPSVSSALSTKIDVKIENDTLKVTPKEKAIFKEGDLVAFGVKAADATTYATASFYIYLGMEKPAVGIHAIAAAPRTGWQGAILADRGVAAMMDMQGRVMWKAKLPVSEADVRNAAAQVQGRKILRVNSQTWTIK